MKTEPRNLYPGEPQNRQRTRREIAPVRGPQDPVLEIGREKVKIGDEENRQPL